MGQFTKNKKQNKKSGIILRERSISVEQEKKTRNEPQRIDFARALYRDNAQQKGQL
jgi:hypothetical protein